MPQQDTRQRLQALGELVPFFVLVARLTAQPPFTRCDNTEYLCRWYAFKAREASNSTVGNRILRTVPMTLLIVSSPLVAAYRGCGYGCGLLVNESRSRQGKMRLTELSWGVRGAERCGI